jgi:hypothetical protein
VHQGALAFLVVVAPTDASDDAAEVDKNEPALFKNLRLHTAEIAGSNPAEPINLLQ